MQDDGSVDATLTFHHAPPTTTTTTATLPSPVGSAQVWWVSRADLLPHLPTQTLPPSPDFVLTSEDNEYTAELLPVLSRHSSSDPERSLCLAGPLTTRLGPPSVLVLTYKRESPHLNAHVFLHKTFASSSKRKAQTVWSEWGDGGEPTTNEPATKRHKRLPVPPPPGPTTVDPEPESELESEPESELEQPPPPSAPSESQPESEPEPEPMPAEPTKQTQPQPSPASQAPSASTRVVPPTEIHPSSVLPERIQYAALVVFQTTSSSSSKSLKVDAVFDQVLRAIRMVPGSGGVRVTPAGLRGLFERLWDDGVVQVASRGLSLPGLVVSQLRWALLTDTWPTTGDELKYLALELKEMARALGFTRPLPTVRLVNWREKYESDLEGWRNECSQILGFVPRPRTPPPRPVTQQASEAGHTTGRTAEHVRERQRIPPDTPPPSSAQNRLAGRLGGRPVTETPPSQQRQTQTTSTSNTYKTQLCKYYLRTRRCPFGDQCRYAHGQQELRPRAPPGNPLASRLGNIGGST